MTTQLGHCKRCGHWRPIAFRNQGGLVLCQSCLEKWLRRVPPPAAYPRTVTFPNGASVTLTGDVCEGSRVSVRGHAYRVVIPPAVVEHVAMLRRGRQP